MAVTKPLTVLGGQIARLQPGDVMPLSRLNLGPVGPPLILASNTITITKSWHRVQAPSGGSSSLRQLRTILGGLEGDILILQRDAAGGDLVIDDGVGNIRCSGDFTMNIPEDKIVFLFDGTNWHELARSNN